MEGDCRWPEKDGPPKDDPWPLMAGPPKAATDVRRCKLGCTLSKMSMLAEAVSMSSAGALAKASEGAACLSACSVTAAGKSKSSSNWRSKLPWMSSSKPWMTSSSGTDSLEGARSKGSFSSSSTSASSCSVLAGGAISASESSDAFASGWAGETCSRSGSSFLIIAVSSSSLTAGDSDSLTVVSSLTLISDRMPYFFMTALTRSPESSIHSWPAFSLAESFSEHS